MRRHDKFVAYLLQLGVVDEIIMSVVGGRGGWVTHGLVLVTILSPRHNVSPHLDKLAAVPNQKWRDKTFQRLDQMSYCPALSLLPLARYSPTKLLQFKEKIADISADPASYHSAVPSNFQINKI